MHPKVFRKPASAIRVLSGLTVACAMGSTAFAAEPFFSGPSMLPSSERVATFSGGNLPAGAAVTVTVTAPNGAAAGYSAVVGADGTLTYKMSPRVAGAYLLTVTDSSGKSLASASFNALR